MKKSSLLTVMLASIMGLVACNKPVDPTPARGPVESAAYAVADLINEKFEFESGEGISPTQSGDYYILGINLGDADLNDYIGYTEQYFIPEGFTAKYDEWVEEEDEDDGTVYTFQDYTQEKVLLEYVFYEDEGDLIFMVLAMRGFLDWFDADDFEYYLGVTGINVPAKIDIAQGALYRLSFDEADEEADEPKCMYALFAWDATAALDASLRAAGWTYRVLDEFTGFAGYFDGTAQLFAYVQYSETYQTSQIAFYLVEDILAD